MRLRSLDFIKAYGIIAFIIWHCYVAYYIHSPDDSPIKRYFLFATGFFILLSGFTVGLHYKKAIDFGVYYIIKKNGFRAIRLLFYMMGANLSVYFVFTQKVEFRGVIELFPKIISIFYLDRWDISLQVLIVIGLGMILNTIFIFLYEKHGSSITVFLIVCISIFSLIDLFKQHRFPYLWRYLPLSTSGMILGIYFNNELLKNTINTRVYLILGVAFTTVATYLSFASAYSIKYYSYFLSRVGAYQLLNISLVIGIGFLSYFYLDTGKGQWKYLRPLFTIIGEYSLFVYILQITIINVGHLIVSRSAFQTDLSILKLSMIILIICYILTNILDNLRRLPFINRVYKIFFG